MMLKKDTGYYKKKDTGYTRQRSNSPIAIYKEAKEGIEYHYTVSKPKVRQISIAEIKPAISDTSSDDYSSLKRSKKSERSLNDYQDEPMISPTVPKTR